MPATSLNVVVFDTTERRFPALTAWWRLGGRCARAAGYADVVIGADSWESALGQMCEAVRERSRTHDRANIGLLQFWGHGTDGAMLIAGKRLDTESLLPESRLWPVLDELRRAMDPARGRLWFRGCNTFRGEEGRRFAQNTAAFFGVPVVGQTFIIWALHSGTHVLEPDATPDWTTEEGVASKRHSGGRWSAPFRPHTISAIRFYPPAP